MGTVKQADVTPQIITKDRTRYLAHTDNLMMVVIEFKDLVFFELLWLNPLRGSIQNR